MEELPSAMQLAMDAALKAKEGKQPVATLAKGNTCHVKDCLDPIHCRDLCKHHYNQRWWNFQHTGKVMTLEELANTPTKRAPRPHAGTSRKNCSHTPIPHPEDSMATESYVPTESTRGPEPLPSVARGRKPRDTAGRAQVLILALRTTFEMQEKWLKELENLL